jgi:amino acid adenylation domain-containing protein
MPTDDEPELSLSLAQQRSWFIDQYVDAPVEALAHAVHLRGHCDTGALAAAVAGVASAHDVLREVIEATGGVARRAPGAHPPELTVDRVSAQRRPAAIEAAVRAGAESLDLAHGPTLTARLLSTDPGDHVLVLVTHRSVADPASLRGIVAEIGRRYAGAEPAPAASLTDFVRAERAASAATPADTAAWVEYLDDLSPLELPTDRVRGLTPRYDAATVDLMLDPALGDAVTALAAGLDATPEEIYRTAFQALLHRWSGQPAVTLGVLDARRDDGNPLIGPVATWRVWRSVPEPGESLTAAIAAGRRRPAALPFETLIDLLQPARDPTRGAVFQAAFTALPDPVVPEFGELTVVDQTLLAVPATLYDVALVVQPQRGGVRAGLTYRADLFDEPTAARMLEHYRQLLRNAVAEPGTPMEQLTYLDAAETDRVLDEFNRTDVPYPADATVQELFEDQVLRTPDSRAVTLEGQHLTYRELNELANRLAHRLREYGVGRGSLVAICLERSFDLIVSALAVLKSGGAYVPLDPAYPTDRLAYTLDDTGARIVLTQARLRDVPPVGDDATVIVLDDPVTAAEVASRGAENPVSVNDAADLTYIVYTSGSTGRPKGVETTHRGVARLVINTDILELDEHTAYLQISPLSFDACTLEIYGPLLNGGRVVLLPPGVPTPARVARTVREQGVDTLWLVAPLANLTIDAHLEDLRGLRQFMAGGDVLSIPHIRRVREELPHVRMVNGYGPTEVTAFSVSHRIEYVDPDWPSIPIGRPMHNTTAYILDEHGGLSGIGVWGELYLGGPGVAVGYHHRPDLNAERFLPDHFRPGPGAQLYRTGDRCRWLPDGTIQFHGRLDTQVKIDGLRVELGEIQSTVAEHPSVSAAVVTAPVIGSRRQLVAYVVPSDEATFDPAQLRAHLSRVLPSVMVPGHYVTLETIPLNPNNKVNFRALPAPESSGDGSRRAPVSETEQVLAGIWEEMLGIGEVGLDDNFFDRGGHSLRAIPMIAAISMRFGVDLAVQDIFETPVLEALASRIEDRMLSSVSSDDIEKLLAEIGG